MNAYATFALLAGASIALQATMNARLGVILKSSSVSTFIAFTVSGIISLLFIILTTKQYPQNEDIRAVPVYLWFSGGMLSAFGVGAFYYLIPKMGMGPMMSYALSGQIVIAIVASHYGWFQLPEKPIDTVKTLGVVSLVTGVVLLNWESANAYG